MARQALMVKDVKDGDVVRGTVHRCPGCEELFIGRADAKTCSAACKMRVRRKAQEETDQ